MGLSISGIKNFVSKMMKRASKQKPYTNVAVGYGAPYAMRVHEDLQMNHPRGGQAKFVEQPMREYRDVILKMIKDEMAKGTDSETALLKAGEFLFAKSQALVPVDTGVLKKSGYVFLVK